MKRILYGMTVVLGLSLTGCVSFNTLGPIGAPTQKAASTLNRGAQISDVAISVPEFNDSQRTAVSKQLTGQVAAYVEKTDYFKKVIVFPAKVGDDDVILKFDLTSLAGRRTPHPAYVPGALLTLTMWIWVNGPIYVDKYDLAGDLVIEDRQGKQLAKSHEQVKLAQNIGLWDDDYFAAALGSEQLRDLIARLLASATPQLHNPSKD